MQSIITLYNNIIIKFCIYWKPTVCRVVGQVWLFGDKTDKMFSHGILRNQ